MPVPDGRADDPVLCTTCAHQFGVIGDYADGDELSCPECSERYQMVYPSQEEIDTKREEARALLADPSVAGPRNPNHEDALVRVRTVRITGDN